MKSIVSLSMILLLMSCGMQQSKNENDGSEKVLFEEMTPNEFRERVAAAPVAYLPLGTIEWHGEHLPLGSDGLQSKGFFEMLARETGGIVYPMLFMGPDRREVIDEKEYYGMDYTNERESSKYHYPTQQLDGSAYWIAEEEFGILMEAILKQISRSGFKVMVAHGHGPSTNFLISHMDEWEEKYDLKILHCWGYMDEEGMGIMVDHAAMNETSLVMALRPELVKMQYLPADTAIWPVGIGGSDPRVYASRETGEEILTIQKERMVGMIREALKLTKSFFSESSFWNLPIGENPEIDPRSEHFIELLKSEPTGNKFGINCNKWTVPVYIADRSTPTYRIGSHHLSSAEKETWVTYREIFGHGPGFGEDVPIPKEATPDPEEDAHLAVIDLDRMLAWDMWGLVQHADGSWTSKTGMKYKLDGEGVFSTEDFDIINGESVHFHGPSRAAGVPIIAGLIMYDEVMAGKICHKLSCATRFNAKQEFVYPASWTDGFTEGGIPEGAVIQLDPGLDLSLFDLYPGEVVVAKALQEYGMVVVDVAGGSPIYAEGLWGHPGKSWDGLLREWDGGINDIPLEHYRILKLPEKVKKGDARWRDGNPNQVN